MVGEGLENVVALRGDGAPRLRSGQAGQAGRTGQAGQAGRPSRASTKATFPRTAQTRPTRTTSPGGVLRFHLDGGPPR